MWAVGQGAMDDKDHEDILSTCCESPWEADSPLLRPLLLSWEGKLDINFQAKITIQPKTFKLRI